MAHQTDLKGVDRILETAPRSFHQLHDWLFSLSNDQFRTAWVAAVIDMAEEADFPAVRQLALALTAVRERYDEYGGHRHRGYGTAPQRVRDVLGGLDDDRWHRVADLLPNDADRRVFSERPDDILDLVEVRMVTRPQSDRGLHVRRRT